MISLLAYTHNSHFTNVRDAHLLSILSELLRPWRSLGTTFRFTNHRTIPQTTTLENGQGRRFEVHRPRVLKLPHAIKYATGHILAPAG